jgi:hypothetical protein
VGDYFWNALSDRLLIGSTNFHPRSRRPSCDQPTAETAIDVRRKARPPAPRLMQASRRWKSLAGKSNETCLITAVMIFGERPPAFVMETLVTIEQGINLLNPRQRGFSVAQYSLGKWIKLFAKYSVRADLRGLNSPSHHLAWRSGGQGLGAIVDASMSVCVIQHPDVIGRCPRIRGCRAAKNGHSVRPFIVDGSVIVTAFCEE